MAGKLNFKNMKTSIAIEELKKIEIKYGDLRPENILKEAKNEKNPLHEVFEWNDSVAGEKYRLHQARLFVDAIVIKHQSGIREIEIRAFHSIITGEGETTIRAYHFIDDILRDKEMREILLIQALRDLKSWSEKYQELKELVGVIKKANQIIMKFDNLNQKTLDSHPT